MFPADTTLANAGNLISSCNCAFHFFSSDKSTFVPNFSIFGWLHPFAFDDGGILQSLRLFGKFMESLESESDKPLADLSLSSCKKTK
jgi:hypothetical protein